MTSNGDDHLNDLAVIGMDARLPGAPDLPAFWDNLRRGVESVAITYETPPVVQGGLAHVRASACVEGMELFDAGFFGFNPREAEVMDPQIRLFLECAWTALESAGYDARQFPGRIGVFAGAASSSYLTANLLRNTELFRSGGGVSSLGVFNNCDALATIASYKFDLTGPSVTVQTFCSTSLVAVHLACQSLLSGESDLALAGASTLNVQADRGYLYQEGGILSPDGHTRSFDARAKGTMFGNGVGVVALKRLADAQADGDVIHAVVRGSAVNNDGARKAGYTAPSVIGQSKAVAEALAVARVSPETIGYVEAHGTATALGDPIEVEALTRAFRGGTSRRGYCAIGSVKSNFGHLDRTAGLAALLKTVLMLKHREIPPSLNFESPNPEIDFESSPFRVATELTEWRTSGGPLRAGVSALGVGGTNAHVIVEEAPVRRPSGPSRASQLLVLSARSEAALDAATERLATHLESAPDQGLGDVAYTLMVGRRRFEHRRTVVSDGAAGAATALRSRDRQRSFTATSSATERPVVFMFPGQGAQYVGMTRGVYETETPYREALDACCERLEPLLGLDLRAELFAPREREAEAAERLRQTALTQPALFAVEYALARLWKGWGVEPSAMIGHSIGEYVAAHLAGVFSLDDALRLVVERGRLMQTMPEGAMLAVPLPAEEVEPLLGETLALAAVNAPSLCVVSGPSREVDSLEARLGERETTGMRLHTSHAFHSPMMDPILAAFRAQVEATTLAAPTLPVVSNRTGGWLTAAQATDPGYWVDHLRHTVRFAEGMRTLLDERERIFLEVGPGTALSGLARLNAPVGEVPDLVTCVRHPKDSQGDQAFVLGALGRLWAAGAPIDSAAVFAGEKRHRVELPTYPFERRRYWIDPPTEGASARSTSGRKDPSRWFYVPVWKTALPPPALPTGNGDGPSGVWLILANDDPLSSRVVSRLREQGEEVFVARPGLRFSGGPREGFTLRATAPDDYDSLLEALGESGGRVSRVVHALCLDPSSHGGPVTDEGLSRGQGRGFYSLLFLAQAMGKLGWGQPLQLRVLTSGAHAVLSGEVLEAEKAPMLGLARVIPQEQHNVRCLALDVAPSDAPEWEDPSALEALLHELRAGEGGAIVAHRRGQRFVQGYEPLTLPAVERPSLLRERGVYLITGGLGGVTFVLAAYLAHVARARLVLTGRARLPGRSEWTTWRQTHGDLDPVVQRLVRIEALENAGAEVLPISADVGSLEDMRRAVALAEERFGEINGVIHGAGIVGGATFRPLAQIGPTECEEQFYPKVKGLMVLDQALGPRPLDFCILTSSLSSVLGGYAYGAYAAANTFMDAYARSRSGPTPWLSVNWDEWRLSREPDGAGGGLARFAMSAVEGAGAFGRLLELRGVSQVVVSTGDLQSRMDEWVKLESLDLQKTDTGSSRPRHPRPQLQNAYAAPGTPTEKKIAAIWAELLGLEKVGIQDNFFDLGGHSLLGIQVVTRIKSELGAEISVASLFEGPTVESLSRIAGPKAEEDKPSFDRSSERGRRRKEGRLRRRVRRTEGSA
jgi:acyl transferase domain-containing protein/acyl carrier protein